MPDDLKTRSIRSLVWAAGESSGVALIALASFVVLARLLSPEDFGVVALAGVFIYFCNLVTTHSFADTLVQRPEIDAAHLDTAFWSTLAIALLLMAGCMIAAAPAATLLGEPRLAEVLPWLALALPLAGLSSVQTGLFRRQMRFDAVASRILVSRGLGAAAGIGAALAGLGVWSLVAQQLTAQGVAAVAFSVAPWRPRPRFSRRRLREMWSFGAQVSANQVVTGASEQALNLLVGALFGTTALGHFTIAWRSVQLIRSLVSSAAYHVGLSAFSKLQKDRKAIADAFVSATRISCLAGFPVAIGLAMIVEPLVLTAFDEKWRASIPLLAILALELVPAFYGMFLNVLYRSLDRPSYGLVMAFLYGGTGIGGALLAVPFGLEAVVAVWAARAFVLMPIHVVLAARLLGRPTARLVAPVAAPFTAAAAMAAGLAVLQLALPASLPPFAAVAALVASGALLYGAAIRLLSPQLVDLALRTAGVLSPRRRRPS